MLKFIKIFLFECFNAICESDKKELMAEGIESNAI